MAIHGGRIRAVSVVVGPVTVPDLVDRPQFVIRVSENQVKLDEFAGWADPLKSQIPRVSIYPHGGDPAAAYGVRVDLQRFNGAPGDAATVEALWSVVPPKGAPSTNGRTLVREPRAGTDYDVLAGAYSRALGAVSRDIAMAIHASLSP